MMGGKLLILSVAGMLALSVMGKPIKDICGAKGTKFTHTEAVSGYVLDGLDHWWDGLLSERQYQTIGASADGMKLKDLVGNVDFLGTGAAGVPYISWYTNANGYANTGTSTVLAMDHDFTLHGVVEVAKSYVWSGWSVLGIGTSAGLENGIVLSGRMPTPTIIYQASYSGTALNTVALQNVRGGDIIVLDVVFSYASKTFKVFVNGEFVGESTILGENWNLDKVAVKVGAQALRLQEENSNVKYWNVMIYKRGLTADEVRQNFNVEKERWKLWE